MASWLIGNLRHGTDDCSWSRREDYGGRRRWPGTKSRVVPIGL